MISSIKKISFSFLLGVITMFLFLVGGEVSVSASVNEYPNKTKEIEVQNKPYSINVVSYVEIPDKIGAHFPKTIWYTRGDYGGYLTIESFERTPDKTLKATYKGILYLHAAPLKEPVLF